MKIDMFTRAMLAIIALALTVIAVRPLLAPTPSYAGRKIEYKLVDFSLLWLNQHSGNSATMGGTSPLNSFPVATTSPS